MLKELAAEEKMVYFKAVSCSANDRFEGRSFEKAGVDQLLKEELHVRNLTLLCG